MNNKLHGYEFWKSINSPKTVCAPMVGQSDLPFRLLVRKYNCQLAYSPMVSSESYIKTKPRKTQVEKYKGHRDKYFKTCKEDRPLFAQFSGNQPDILLQAAQDFEDDVDAIDINFGCPQGVAKRGNYGSYLLDQPEIVYSLINKLHKNLKVPVTAKIRILKDDVEGTIKLAKLIEEAGASVLAVHGRTRDQKGESVTQANWDVIKLIKENVNIPVIANGGIYNYQDYIQCLEYTKVDAVMSCEGLLEYPALFSEKQQDLDIDYIAQQYLDICKTNMPVQTCFIKSHLCKFFYSTLMVNEKNGENAENYIPNKNELEIFLNKSKTFENYQEAVKRFTEARKHIKPIDKRGFYFRWWKNGKDLQKLANTNKNGTLYFIKEQAEQKEKKDDKQIQQQQQQQVKQQQQNSQQMQRKDSEKSEKREDNQQYKDSEKQQYNEEIPQQDQTHKIIVNNDKQVKIVQNDNMN